MRTLLLLADTTPKPTDEAETWLDLFSLKLLWSGISLHVGWLLVVAVVLFAVVTPLIRKGLRKKRWAAEKVKLAFPNLFEMEICPDHETARIAYQAWVEITTRKAGLLFDPEQDVVTEVYSSWYQLFQVLRDLTKTVRVQHLKECEDTQKLVTMLVKVMNEGLRPHLTKWQARYRRWWEAARAKPENADKSPQEIQKEYPQFSELVGELKVVNASFVDFAKALRQLADGGEG